MSFGLGSVVDLLNARNKRRFSLLLLEEREYYFEDSGGFLHVADNVGNASAVPFSARRRIKGRIHICSKNIVFDPDDGDVNLIRLPLRDIASIKPRRAPEGEYFVVHTRCAVEIPTHAPFVFHKLDLSKPSSEYVFSLSYNDQTTFLAFVNQLHALYRLPNSGAGVGTKAHALAELIRTREERIPFESSCIVDIRERPLLPNGAAILAQQVLPLLLCPGRFQLTDLRFYFQQFNSISISEAVTIVEVSEIKRLYKRRFGMRDTALEIFVSSTKGNAISSSNSRNSLSSAAASSASSSASSSSPLSQSSIYLNFPSSRVRDMVFTLITTQCPKFNAAALNQSLLTQTAAWVRGEISNFSYLLFLNQHAGRSWLDLTQYPVFPWVLSDYTSPSLDLQHPSIYRDLSKPVGALNPERLAGFRRRMREMPAEISQGHPFLYGTHYSSPGYVLYFLVRRAPNYMLKLQNGKYDHADRLFHNMAATWKSVLEAPTDVKELLPEFYATAAELNAASGATSSSSSAASPGDFLRNSLELDLGTKQNGREIGDVELPPWAQGSPKEFVRIMRAALESEYVSAHLHEWIDLIFGYKQRGPEAEKADNVFYYLTYEGAVDLETIEDAQQKKSLELQINEFGQTPKQIFFTPHPKRFDRNYDAQAEEAKQAAIVAAANAAAASSSAAAAPASASSTQLLATFALKTDFSRALSDDGEAPASSPYSGTGSAISTTAATAAAAGQHASLFNFSSALSPTHSNSPPILPMNQSLSGLLSPPATRTAAEMAALDRDAQTLQLAAEVHNIQTRELRLDHDELTLSSSPTVRSTVPSVAAAAASAGGSSAAASARPTWSSCVNSASGWSRREQLSLHRDAVTCVDWGVGDNLTSVSSDGHIKIYSLSARRLIRSAKVCDMTLSSCVVAPDGKHVYVSSWDNHVSLYNLSFGRVVSSVQAHDDAVSCMAVRAGVHMLTGSWDTTLHLFAVTATGITPQPTRTLAEHEAAITAVALDGSAAVTAVSGAEDGSLALWDVRAREAHARIIEGFDGAAVRSIAFSPASNDFVVSAADGSLRHVDAGTGRALATLPCRSAVHSLRSDGFSVLGACEDGFVRSWSLLRPSELLMQLDTAAGPLVSLATNTDATLIAVAGGQKASVYTHSSAVIPDA